jgi:hypothetical protein
MQPRRVQIQKIVLKPQHVLTQPTVTKLLQPVPGQQDVPDVNFFFIVNNNKTQALLSKLKHNCKLNV